MNASQKMFAGIIRRFDMARSSKKYLRLRYRRKVEWCDNTHPSYLAAIFFGRVQILPKKVTQTTFVGLTFRR